MKAVTVIDGTLELDFKWKECYDPGNWSLCQLNDHADCPEDCDCDDGYYIISRVHTVKEAKEETK